MKNFDDWMTHLKEQNSSIQWDLMDEYAINELKEMSSIRK